jgi:hypothetical protein
MGKDGERATTVWALQCFPSGDNEENAGFVSVYLHLKSLSQLAVDRVRAEVSFWQLFADSLGLVSHDQAAPYYWGHPRYVRHGYLASKAEVVLKGQKLTIVCDITLLPLAGPRSYVIGDHSPPPAQGIPAALAEVNAADRDRRAWARLKEETFVDLGHGAVTLVFGTGAARTEELAHTFPLAARSPVLLKALTLDMVERSSGRIEMPDMSPATGKEFVYFLYTGSLRSAAQVPELLAAAEKYDIGELKEHCIKVSVLCIRIRNFCWPIESGSDSLLDPVSGPNLEH